MAEANGECGSYVRMHMPGIGGRVVQITRDNTTNVRLPPLQLLLLIPQVLLQLAVPARFLVMLRTLVILVRFVADTYVYSLELNVTAGIRPAHTHTHPQLIALCRMPAACFT